METILVCDDDREIVEAIDIYLTQEGYQVLKAYDGIEALEMLKNNEVHLLVIDVMMPRLDGLRATLKIRQESSIPIIILSAKSEDADKILGLNVGADDYVTKPFNPLELTASYGLGDTHERLIPADIWSELTFANHHILALPLGQRIGESGTEEIQCLLHSNGEYTLPLEQGSELRFLIFAIAYLYAWTVLRNTRQDGLPCLRMLANQTRCHFAYGHLLNERMESLVEVIHRLHPVCLARSDSIETLLRLRREIITQDMRELLHQEVIGNATQVGRHQFARIRTHHFGLMLVRQLTSF